MYSTTHKIKPYNSPTIPVKGIAQCAVTQGTTSIPVKWYILDTDCKPVLSGIAGKALGLIHFNKPESVYKPINMISCDYQTELQTILSKFPENFQGVGKLKSHQIKLHLNTNDKPVVSPQRTVPYHLQERVDQAINEMIKNDVIEEHPSHEPAPWISNTVVTPNSDGTLRITLDARNINRSIQSTNLPIPRQEDIKAKLNGNKIFSKMDFKTAFWQLELHPSSRHITCFLWEK